MTITLSALQKQRYDTAANWTAENPTLLAGEIGVESDTGKIKIGTGSTAWTSLSYSGLIPGSGVYPYSQLLMPSGTAGAPSISFDGDGNTGIYRSGADALALSTNGTGRLFVDASGNVGISVTPSPWASSWKVIQALGGSLGSNSSTGILLGNNLYSDGTNWRYVNTAAATQYFQVSGEHFWSTAASGTAGNAITFQERMRLDSSGRLGIGTSTARAGLTVGLGSDAIPAAGVATGSALFSNATGAGAYGLVVGATSGGLGYIQSQRADGTATTYNLALQPNGGSVGIGTTSAGSPLHVKANSSEGIRIESPDFAGIYGLLTSRRSSGSPLDIAAVHSVGALEPEISFSRSTNGSTFSESARFDKSGRLLVGTSSVRQGFFNGVAQGTQLEVEGLGLWESSAAYINNENSTGGHGLVLARSRGTSKGSFTTVQNNDVIGGIYYQGADGTDFVEAARIVCEADGTPGANDMPGRLVFSTTADGASSPTEHVRIDSSGKFLVGTPNAESGGERFVVKGNPGGDYIASFVATNPSTAPFGLWVKYSAVSPNSTGARFLTCADSTATRLEIRSNGGLANYQANDVNLSDRNAKKDISPAAGTWNCIKEWEIVNYRYKDQPDDADLNLGVIAQQVAESCPEVITVFQEATEDEPEKLGVKEQQMYWMAIKALQEAQVRIEALEAEVAALKAS